MLREIFGLVCVAGYCRSRSEAIIWRTGHSNRSKKGRLRWLGHVERMSEGRVVKRLYQNTAEGSRNVGRRKFRWMDDVREDLRRMGVTNWRIRAHRREDWKRVVKEVKVLQGL